MPIGSTNVYNPGDLILSTVSGSGTSFIETKIAAATSSLILFNSNGTLTSASLNSTTVGTSSYVSGSTSIITSITASNISASGRIIATSFTGSLLGTSSWAINASTASYVSPSGNAFVQGGNSFGTTALLGTNDAQSLALETNGTTRMSINSNGNVGIGTTVPTGSLHIQNSVANVPILNLGGGVAFNNVSDLYVLNSYNTASGVGFAAKVIGVNISGSLTAENIPVQRTVWSGVASATAIVLSSDDPGSGNQDNAFQIWTSNEGTSGSLLTQKFSLSSTGDVGIGTTLPGEKLTVSGSSYIIGGTGAVGTGTAYYLGGSNKDISLTRVDAATLAIGRYYPSAWAETIRFTADGNVGIGTSSPTAKLQVGTQVFGSAPDANYFVVGNNDFTGAGPVGAVNGYPVTANRNQVTASIFDVVGGWERINGSHALLRVSAYDVINSTPALTVLNNGNVGIGVTNPLGRLHITASATNGESLVYLSKGSGSITQHYINAVNQLGQLNYRVSSDINGHASQTLYFAGTIHVYHDSYWSSFINNANYVQGGLGIGTTSQTHGYGVTIARPATSGSLYVSGSSVFTGSVSISDNVGIGTMSTSDKLSVISGSTRIASSALAGVLYLGNDTSNIYLQRDNNYDLSLVQNGDSNSALYLASAGNVYVNIDSNNNDTDKAFIVQNNALKAGTELFRIQENGNVGVGTSSPTAKLHIYNGSSHFEATSNGNAAIVSGLYALQIAPLSNRDSTAGSYYGGIAFNHLLNLNGVSTYNGAPQAWIGTRLQDTVGSERDYLVFATKPGTGVSGTGNDIPIERMCIDRDGLVGIGTTVPTARLHVSGSTIITGSLNVSANITCLSLTETSTEAVKYNILPLPSQLDNVLKLKPVSFNYKTNDKHSIGLIAEEVAKIYPEFTSDNNDSISYGKITSVLIQSIKELKTIIDNQQKQIEDLVNKLK